MRVPRQRTQEDMIHDMLIMTIEQTYDEEDMIKVSALQLLQKLLVKTRNFSIIMPRLVEMISTEQKDIGVRETIVTTLIDACRMQHMDPVDYIMPLICKNNCVPSDAQIAFLPHLKAHCGKPLAKYLVLKAREMPDGIEKIQYVAIIEQIFSRKNIKQNDLIETFTEMYIGIFHAQMNNPLYEDLLISSHLIDYLFLSENIFHSEAATHRYANRYNDFRNLGLKLIVKTNEVRPTDKISEARMRFIVRQFLLCFDPLQRLRVAEKLYEADIYDEDDVMRIKKQTLKYVEDYEVVPKSAMSKLTISNTVTNL
ncbi:unnamed protein product [Caenorhabditis angaria]|uniref:Uncharacterized protein n=1 Tax=Caenorhabditis angaria TaxID=860376 RepID=A0A9P1J3K4_9PELO|nr:unnamed protein product [Caenorhabditis angaria]